MSQDTTNVPQLMQEEQREHEREVVMRIRYMPTEDDFWNPPTRERPQ